MADTHITNYPDILGTITGGSRYNVGPVQLALATNPRVVRAGRPFEVILLVQNAADVDVDITATLNLPAQDTRRQKGRFVAKRSRIVVGLRPAEVGFVKLPVTCLPDTAPHDRYKLSMETGVKALGKASRVRAADGGGDFDPDHLDEQRRPFYEGLRRLDFSTARPFGLRESLELTFGVLPGTPGKLADFKPGWVSLWLMSDLRDEQPLVQRYGTAMLERVLPALNRDHVLTPLLHITEKAFAGADYPLKPLEALFITKLLTRLLEMAAPRENVFDFMAGDIYNVSLTLRKALAGEIDDPQFPHWFDAALRLVARQTNLLETPTALLGPLYLDILRDASAYAFTLIKTATGESMGTDEEMSGFTDMLIERLRARNGLDFTHIYMPLILGGIILNDRIIQEGEDIAESLRGMSDIIAARDDEIDESNELIVDLVRLLVNRSLQKYGIEI